MDKGVLLYMEILAPSSPYCSFYLGSESLKREASVICGVKIHISTSLVVNDLSSLIVNVKQPAITFLCSPWA